MYKLDKPITLYPPAYTDPKTNKLIKPQPITLEQLDVTFMDNPTNKKVSAYIRPIPIHLLLFDKTEYDILGDYTQAQLDNILEQKLGEDPQKTLQSLYPPTLEQDPNGPGTILASMFSKIGIKSTPTCSCRRHALEMNQKGVEWCENNISTITGWLKEESKKRKIPFVEPIATMVVKRAINQSKKRHNIE